MSQPLYELTLHPVDLTRHGVTPYGFSLYRVVWADTRKSKVLYHGKIHELPRYFHGDESSAAGKWVLEKWVAPEILLGMSRDAYDQFLAAMPHAAAEAWPERGDYELSYVFPANVDEVMIHKQLEMHEHRHNHMNLGDHLREAEAVEESKEKEQSAEFDILFEQAKENS